MSGAYTGLAVVRPDDAPDAFQRVTIPAGAAGEATAQATVNLGKAIGQVGDFYQEVATDEAFNEYQSRVQKLLNGDPNRPMVGPDGKPVVGPDGKPVPDSGFMGMKGRAAMEAAPSLTTQLNELEKQIGGGLKSPAMSKAFNAYATRYRASAEAQISAHTRDQQNVWAENTNKASERLAFHDIAANWNNPEKVKHSTEDAVMARVKRVQANGGDATQIVEAEQSARRDALKIQIEAMGANNPGAAVAAAEKNRATLGIYYDELVRKYKSEAENETGRAIGAEVSGLTPTAADVYTSAKADLAARGITLPAPSSTRRPEDRGSQHQGGHATDIPLKGRPEAEQQAIVARLLADPRTKGFGFYPNNGSIHVDTGEGPVGTGPNAAPRGTRTAWGQDTFAGSVGVGWPAWMTKMVKDWQAGTLPQMSPSEPKTKSVGDMIAQVMAHPAASNPRVMAAALAQVSQIHSLRTAQKRELDDASENAQLQAITKPAEYVKGTFEKLAKGYEAIGDYSAARSVRIIDENELLGFAQSSLTAQAAIQASQLTGKAKELATAIRAEAKHEQTEAKAKERAEKAVLVQEAKDDFSALKGYSEKNPLAPLTKKAEETAEKIKKSGDINLMRDFHEYVVSMGWAQAVGNLPPTIATQVLNDLKTAIEAGDQDNISLRKAQRLEEVMQQQAAAFAKDAYRQGTNQYEGTIGPSVKVNWDLAPDVIASTLGVKVRQAREISRLQNGMDVLPFDNDEIDGLRNTLNASNPAGAQKIMQMLSSLPPDMVPKVAAALAGKEEASDPLTKSYSAALMMYADNNPETVLVANQVLQGALLRKSLGPDAKVPTAGTPWQSTLEGRLGNSMKDMTGTPMATAQAAIASYYLYQAYQQGIQGRAAPDTDLLDKSITAVLGKTVDYNGQVFWPPVRGMGYYDVQAALATLTPEDLKGIRTANGDQITPEAVRSYGIFSNKADGIYVVRMAQRGEPREILDPRTNEAWKLDMRPLVQRAKAIGYTVPKPMETPGQKATREGYGASRAPLPTLVNPADIPPPAIAPSPPKSGADAILGRQRDMLNKMNR